MSTKYLDTPQQALQNALGTELCWGWSPAFDILDLYARHRRRNASTPEKPATTTASAPAPAAPAAPAAADDEDDDPFFAELLKEAAARTGKPMSGTSVPPPTVPSSAPATGAGSASPAGSLSPKRRHLHILLLGAADIRHVFLTLSRMFRNEMLEQLGSECGTEETCGSRYLPPIVHFHLYEPNLRAQCRHLFFLQYLCSTTMTLGELEDRVSIFLELYGDSLVRDVTASTLKATAQQLMKQLALVGSAPSNAPAAVASVGPSSSSIRPQEQDGETESESKGEAAAPTEAKPLTQLHQLVDWCYAKDAERDFIEGQLQHWAKDKDVVFDVTRQWDARVRHEHADRYDNRVNLIDWDFNFSCVDYSDMLKFPEYREFRLTGMAYDYARINPRKGFKYDYTQPNKTLAHFVKIPSQRVITKAAGPNLDAIFGPPEGAASAASAPAAGTATMTHAHVHGYYRGDVKVGPFWALAGDTENEELRKRGVDQQVRCGNGTIAMHNVRGWWYEFLTGQRWAPTNQEHLFAWDDEKNYNVLPAGAPTDTEFRPVLPFTSCRFHMWGLDLERTLRTIERQNEAPLATAAAATAATTAVTCGGGGSGSVEDIDDDSTAATAERKQPADHKREKDGASKQSNAVTAAESVGELVQFDVVFVGAACAQHLNAPGIWNLLRPAEKTLGRPGGIVVAETVKHVVDAKDEAKQAFVAKLTSFAAAHGACPVDEVLTAHLHARLPEPRKAPVGDTPAPGIVRATERIKFPHALVFAKK